LIKYVGDMLHLHDGAYTGCNPRPSCPAFVTDKTTLYCTHCSSFGQITGLVRKLEFYAFLLQPISMAKAQLNHSVKSQPKQLRRKKHLNTPINNIYMCQMKQIQLNPRTFSVKCVLCFDQSIHLYQSWCSTHVRDIVVL